MFIFLCKNIFSLDISGCDVTLNVTDTKQYFGTEGYPHYYKNNQNCHFNFMAPSGTKIIVVFEVFNLEKNYDFLYFRKFQNIKISNALTVIHKKNIWGSCLSVHS